MFMAILSGRSQLGKCLDGRIVVTQERRYSELVERLHDVGSC
jgi:hypothetical protein